MPSYSEPLPCFICHSHLLGPGVSVPSRNRTTIEHFIPLWLLREGGYHKAGKTNHYLLPNGVGIKGHATVPCCRRCNERLGLLERPIQELFKSKKPLDALDRETMFLWLLKVAYGSASREASSNMSTRQDIDFGKVISSRAFGRMKRFHGRILREYCEEGSIAGLKLLPYSMLQAETNEQGLVFSKSLARSRVTVAWNGNAFRLALDNGKEEFQLLTRGSTLIPEQEFFAFLGSEDLFPNDAIEYPEIRRRRQKNCTAKARKLSEGDEVLLTQMEKLSREGFRFSGHILENNQIVGEENMVMIIIKRSYQKETAYLDEIEVHQPGLRLVTRTAAAVMNYSEALGIEDDDPTPKEEMITLLFIVHEALKIRFHINPTLLLGVASIP